MPLTWMEELQEIRSKPLPGGHGRIARQREREEQLRGKMVQELFELMNDCEGVRGLFELYMELLCGKQLDDPGICLTDAFKELWNDYHPEGEDMDDVLPSESPDARKHGDSFTPRTELYGREVNVYDANEENKDAPPKKAILRQIKSRHCFLLDFDGRTEEWEVDSANDFDVGEDGTINLWNAW